jgi:hypothetical protein
MPLFLDKKLSTDVAVVLVEERALTVLAMSTALQHKLHKVLILAMVTVAELQLLVVGLAVEEVELDP